VSKLAGLAGKKSKDKADGADNGNKQQSQRKQKIFADLPEEIRGKLHGNIWTRISDEPPKFLVARRQQCEICRARIDLHEETVKRKNGKPDKKKVYSLEHGTIVFKIFHV
jgi:hypothetical protein